MIATGYSEVKHLFAQLRQGIYKQTATTPKTHRTFKKCSQCINFKTHCILGYRATKDTSPCRQGVLKYGLKKRRAI